MSTAALEQAEDVPDPTPVIAMLMGHHDRPYLPLLAEGLVEQPKVPRGRC